MVLAIQCPASQPETGEKGEMDMNPKHGLGRSLFSALNTLGTESGHPELRDAKLIVLGFSGTGAYFGHFVASAPDRVVAAILTNPGQADPENVDKITLDEKAVAVPELIIVGGRDTVGGTVKPYNYKRYHAQGAPWVYLVQNNIPHCCIIDTKSFILDWLQQVIVVRRPDPNEPLSPMNSNTGWYGSIRPCEAVYSDHWGCLCGMSATRTLNVQRRICRRRKCQRVSFLLNFLHKNGSPTLDSRTTPRTPSLVLRTHLSESQSKARHVRKGAIVSIGAKSLVSHEAAAQRRLGCEGGPCDHALELRLRRAGQPVAASFPSS